MKKKRGNRDNPSPFVAIRINLYGLDNFSNEDQISGKWPASLLRYLKHLLTFTDSLQ